MRKNTRDSLTKVVAGFIALITVVSLVVSVV